MAKANPEPEGETGEGMEGPKMKPESGQGQPETRRWNRWGLGEKEKETEQPETRNGKIKKKS